MLTLALALLAALTLRPAAAEAQGPLRLVLTDDTVLCDAADWFVQDSTYVVRMDDGVSDARIPADRVLALWRNEGTADPYSPNRRNWSGLGLTIGVALPIVLALRYPNPPDVGGLLSPRGAAIIGAVLLSPLTGYIGYQFGLAANAPRDNWRRDTAAVARRSEPEERRLRVLVAAACRR